MPNQGVPVIFKNKIAYGYAEKSVQAYDVSVSDYNALTEQQQLDGSIRFIQGVDAIPNGSNVWAKLGTTPLAEGLPRDCSQAVNQLKSNLTELDFTKLRGAWVRSINTTTTTNTVTMDKTLDNYSFILVVFYSSSSSGNMVKSSVIVPMYFVTSQGAQQANAYIDGRVYINISKTSDTTLSLSGSFSGAQINSICVYVI